ncbi:MAG TPA: DUF2817 domain-containing protein [Candidatus Gastranaerophilaceae bacterium]|nr:DUF2817 domain-containing protein [Candidatus Gastranaerophilaceae bacterium]HPT41258.1 DUF2817 domain-containing protein [Candidatus Gastranaerophilaceae bacterium]
MENIEILKRTLSKNGHEIILVEQAKKENIPLTAHGSQLTVLIIGVVHGDEPQGKFLIENYLQNTESKSKNRLLFIPCLNPDGLENNTRSNSNGVDINRNFPTKNWGGGDCEVTSNFYGGESPASEIETKFILEIMKEYSPDVILTLHSPYRVVNYDGPAKETAEKIGQIMGYPVSSDIGYSTPGSFGTYAGVERNIPIITLELDDKISIYNLILPIKQLFEEI